MLSFHKLQDFFRLEGKKLSSMTIRQKCQYLFQYYKLFFLGSVLFLFILFLTADAVLSNQKETVLNGLITNDEQNLFPARKISQDYSAFAGLNSSQRLLLDDGLYIDQNGQATEITAASRGKIIAELTTGQLDFVITSEPAVLELQEQIPLRSLDTLLPDPLWSKCRDHALQKGGASGSPVYYAISLEKSRFMTSPSASSNQRFYLFVPQSAPHPDQIISFIDYCFPAAS